MIPTSHPASLQLCGTRAVNLELGEAVAAIDAALAARVPTRIAFLNADCSNIAARNPAYRDDLAACDWVFVDGAGMRLAGRVLNQPVRDNVNGTDLFPQLCASLAARGARLYLLGAKPGVAAAVGAWASQHYPGLVVAGCCDGYYPSRYERAVTEDIRARNADVVLVALGAPRQEAWMQRNLAACGATVVIGVGGLFDYYSGNIPRAPHWMRRNGLEWVFRLYQEPGRLWRRYLLGNCLFIARLAGHWLAHAWRRRWAGGAA